MKTGKQRNAAIIVAIFALAFALTALSLTGCPSGGGGNNGPGPEIPVEPGPSKVKYWKDLSEYMSPVGTVTARPIESGGGKVYADMQITPTVLAVTREVDDMRVNMLTYAQNSNDAWKSAGYTFNGYPSDEFMKDISDFHGGVFVNGHDGMGYRNYKPFDIMLDDILNLEGMIDEKDKALFTAYVNAYRGVNFISARHQVNNDYTTEIDLGNGAVTIGDLLQNVNDNNGGGTAYELDGQYPAADLYAGASALIPNADNAYPDLIKDVITEMGNFEQLLGMLLRAQSLGYDTTFTQEAIQAIARAADNRVSRETIKVDQPPVR